MADKQALKIGDTVQLVAVERGFRDGALLERGTRFSFTVSALDKQGNARLPKWAQPADKPLPPPKRMAGDLKPRAAQQAVKGKAAALTGGNPDEASKAGDALA